MSAIVESNDGSQAIQQAIEANWGDCIRTFGLAPQVELHDEPDMLWFITGIPAGGFNAVQAARLTSETLEGTFSRVQARFKQRKVPSGWLVGPFSQPPHLAEWLQSRGLRAVGNISGFALEIARLHEPPFPPGLRIELVRDAAMLDEWSAVESVGFEATGAVAEGIIAMRNAAGWGEHLPMRRFLGLLNGVPVATATLLPSAGVAGIYDVATVPQARRQGIAAAMTAYLLRQGQALGYRLGILQPSQMGRRVYERLGFREYSVYTAYA